MKEILCYSCHAPISRKAGTEKTEHIPAQNLFAGFTDKHKKNRITVPACTKCNNETSAIDEEFRNLIGSASNLPELQEISKRTVKSIFERREFDRLLVDQSGGVSGVKVNKKAIIENHVKIFKGLFYNQYHYPLPKEYKVVATFEPTEATGSCIKYLKENFNFKFSGDPAVFEYCVQPFRESLINPAKADLDLFTNEPVFIGLMIYNKTHAALAFATNRPIKKANQSH